MDRERSNHGEIQHKFQKESRTSNARIQARQVEERPCQDQGEEPQAGERDRVVGGTEIRSEGAEPEVVFAQRVEPQQKPEHSEPQRYEPQPQPERVQPPGFIQPLDEPQVHQPDPKIV